MLTPGMSVVATFQARRGYPEIFGRAICFDTTLAGSVACVCRSAHTCGLVDVTTVLTAYPSMSLRALRLP